MAQVKKVLAYLGLIVLLFLAVAFIVIYRGKIMKIFSPFLMAMIIAYLIHPLVIRLERKGVKRMYGILSLYALFLSGFAAVFFFVFPEVIRNGRELILSLPRIIAQYQGYIDSLFKTIQSSEWAPEMKNTLHLELQKGLEFGQVYLMGTLKKGMNATLAGLSVFLDFILALIISYYYIKDAGFFSETLLSVTPRRWRNALISTGRDINDILSSFIQGQLLTALIVGIMETVGLMIVHVKFPLVLGLVGGLANIIPYFGPFLGAIPAVALALIDSPWRALSAIMVFIIVQQIDNAFISPKIIEGRLGLHPVTTILAVLVGGEFAGILGMIISVPITAVMKAIIMRAVNAIV